jgi:hypothetical protein
MHRRSDRSRHKAEKVTLAFYGRFLCDDVAVRSVLYYGPRVVITFIRIQSVTAVFLFQFLELLQHLSQYVDITMHIKL